jgi:H+/gluconate symporter-like permease
MPSTRPNRTQKPTHESIRTAIIVGLIIGVIGLLILAYLSYQRRLRRNVKEGTRPGTIAHMAQLRGERGERDVEKGLEVGVVQEPLPVYRKEPMEDEKRLEMAIARGSTAT